MELARRAAARDIDGHKPHDWIDLFGKVTHAEVRMLCCTPTPGLVYPK